MYTFNSTPSPQQARVIAASLAKIGITANIKLASIDAMFTKFCVVQQYLPEVCTLGWLPDFKDPVTMLDPLFNGKSINPNYTNNMTLLNDPPSMPRSSSEADQERPGPLRRLGQDRPDDHAAGADRSPTLDRDGPVISDRIIPGKQLWNAGLSISPRRRSRRGSTSSHRDEWIVRLAGRAGRSGGGRIRALRALSFRIRSPLLRYVLRRLAWSVCCSS